MQTNKSIIWRQLDNQKSWSLFNNNSEDFTKNPPNQSHNKKLFYIPKKRKGKGSVVHTPEGYGIIQTQENEQGIIKIKVDSDIKEYSKNQIRFDIPLTINVAMNNVTLKKYINVPANYNSKDLLIKLAYLINQSTEEDPEIPSVFFKGKQIEVGKSSLKHLGILPHSKLLVLFAVGQTRVLQRFPKTNNGWGYAGSHDAISFKVSKPVNILGLGIYNNNNGDQLHGTYQLREGPESDNGQLLQEGDAQCQINPDYYKGEISPFKFSRKVKIKADQFYTLVAKMKGGNGFYGGSGQTTYEEEGGVVFTFNGAKGQTNGSSVSSGQIPQILYSV